MQARAVPFETLQFRVLKEKESSVIMVSCTDIENKVIFGAV